MKNIRNIKPIYKILIVIFLFLLNGATMFYAIYNNEITMGISATGGLKLSWELVIFVISVGTLVMLVTPADIKQRSTAYKIKFFLIFFVGGMLFTFLSIGFAIFMYVQFMHDKI